MLTSEMVRAARALLRWEQADLAEKAGVSLPTIKRIEKEPGPIPGRTATAQAIEAAFAKARIEFSFDRGEAVTKLRPSIK
ncbi:helix-turn-helix domain-containing protein [Bradyrhizobium pachyrhizi]|uniref:Helix-turn-helix domain-containing protein n=2 Tax=Bradyrhizobium pachyrhizi TaxID=280333 RepID=A0A844T356_9BRAD|nr:helix-turn-helix domain-containing protein [Bradyrhizobium pachyrhizi]MVT69962.1 helix-turn-helix domain-containing protein [Bradyrhizobium pachyrhizi]